MSYDLYLYAAKSVDLGAPVLSEVGWFEISGPMTIEPDDLSEAESSVIGQRRLHWQISLSNQTSEQDWAQIEAWLSQVLGRSKGVVIDPQNGTYQTASRRRPLKRDPMPPRDPSWLCFWFKDGEGFHAHGLKRLLNTLTEVLPEALPRRFGDYEPLQGKVLGDDYGPLLAAFAQDPGLFLAAPPPFGDFLMGIPCARTFSRYHPNHPIKSHFLLAVLKIKVREACFDTPSLLDKVTMLFERLCVELDVVYGEFTAPMDYPWGSWFWDGLPDRNPRSFCIGHDYRAVWPEAEGYGREVGSHHRLFVRARDGSGLPKVRSDLVSPRSVPLEAGNIASISSQNRNLHAPPKLAQTFPFDFTFSPDKHIW